MSPAPDKYRERVLKNEDAVFFTIISVLRTFNKRNYDGKLKEIIEKYRKDDIIEQLREVER